ncbi:MAG TPA: DUF4142 domain-containing protein [Planctomycetota bacterium]|nr:DUF4142 domain-containing protein [Planctomycetota bacterium]
MIRLLPIVFVSATVALTAFQQNPPSQTPPTPRAPSSLDGKDQRPEAKEADGILATWLVVGGDAEVALARIAAQKASDPEVKQFAQRMIDDHTQMGQKLQAFASAAGHKGEGQGADRPTDVSGNDRKEPNPAREASAPRAMGGFDHVALAQELGDQCLQTSRRELEQKQGADFDRCYIGMAVGGHMHTSDMLTVFQRHASSSLKPVLSDAQGTVTKHLQEAKDLMKKLEGKSGASRDAVGGK